MQDLKHKIMTQVQDDLSAIETALARNLNPHYDLVAQTAKHILFAGGKRLRPLLMVLAARLNNYQGLDDKTLSTVFEYLHAATLLHDDLVDGAAVRRGKQVAHALFGNSTAVLTGDFLLARSLSLAAQNGRLKVIKIIANITEHMSQGEIQQLAQKGNLNLTETEYMEVIRYKTAVLIQGACRVGAIIADASASKEAALSDYGFNLGVAFQMADDLLDYTADSDILGKVVGTDLKEGKLTLPLIHALAKAAPDEQAVMGRIIQKEDFSRQDFNTLLKLLKKYGGLDYTQRQAAAHIHKAKDALAIFPLSETRQLLYDIADYALTREL